jgi:hypothetical protein
MPVLDGGGFGSASGDDRVPLTWQNGSQDAAAIRQHRARRMDQARVAQA